MTTYYENTKTVGDNAEIEVMSYLHKHGYTVSIPFGENAPYDLVIESPERRMYRVQVRASTWTNNTISLSLRIVSKNYKRTIDRNRVDVFVLWDGERPFIIPTEDTLECKAQFRLRREKTKNGQTKGIRMAQQYSEATNLIP